MIILAILASLAAMRRRVRSSSRGHTDWNFAVSSARLPIHRQQSSLYQELISLFFYSDLVSGSRPYVVAATMLDFGV